MICRDLDTDMHTIDSAMDKLCSFCVKINVRYFLTTFIIFHVRRNQISWLIEIQPETKTEHRSSIGNDKPWERNIDRISIKQSISRLVSIFCINFFFLLVSLYIFFGTQQMNGIHSYSTLAYIDSSTIIQH